MTDENNISARENGFNSLIEEGEDTTKTNKDAISEGGDEQDIKYIGLSDIDENDSQKDVIENILRNFIYHDSEPFRGYKRPNSCKSRYKLRLNKPNEEKLAQDIIKIRGE